ncbi:MAG TPA: DUF1223 domain-containing protein [Blastocatellia bacterium]|nr:DUF1223 domain-containing protein [Blastocatellia bacterium]
MPNKLMLFAIQLLMSALVYSPSGVPSIEEGQDSAGATPVVLVELFTSEGCSSCPPADRVLTDLDEKQPINGVQIVTMSEHVDYWNRLGWRDPFSSADFSRRQSEYARVLGIDDVYTPQMVVDGRTEFVGSNVAAARDAIAKAAHTQKTVVNASVKKSTPRSVQVVIEVPDPRGIASNETADVVLCITESGLLSDVSRGENRGRKLSHSGVVRKLIVAGAVQGKSFAGEKTVELDPKWKPQNLRAVAFVQERASRRVVGATEIRLAENVGRGR